MELGGVDLSFEPWCTPEEFARFLENNDDERNRYELLNGRIVMTPPPTFGHSDDQASIVTLLRTFVAAKALGRAVVEVDVLLPSGDWVRPDVAFVNDETAATLDRDAFPARFVPDLVVEIVSPGTASRDRGEKRVIYARNKVREYWIVDERAGRITRFDLEGDDFGPPHVFGADDVFASRLLDGFTVPVRDMFPRRP